MDQVLEWLPEKAFTAEAARSILHDVLSSWADRWFTRTDVDVRSARLVGTDKPVGQGIHVCGVNNGLLLSGRGKRALLEAALGTELSATTLTKSDHEILDAFATAIIRDLVTTVEALGGRSFAEPHFSVTLALGNSEFALMDLSAPAFTGALKKAAGSSGKSAQALESRTEALKKTLLNAQGYLGHADLTLSELQSLEVGDVVVLAQALKDPVELRLPDNPKFVKRGKLMRTAESISIQF